MSLSKTELRSIPLLAGMTDTQLHDLTELFERLELPLGEELFRAGDPGDAFYLLESGQVHLSGGDQVQIDINPPAPIGELGALSGIVRNTTATVKAPAVIWRASSAALHRFLCENCELGLVFYQNMMQVVADKIRRDQLRLDDMRRNIIRTQKTMKQLRDYVLESEDTPVSERMHDALEGLIRNNRRVNYRVTPPETLSARVRLAGGGDAPIVQISRTHLSYCIAGGPLPAAGEHVTGVAVLAGPEIAISGRVLRTIDRRVDVELDLMIDDYVATLEGYLSRVQMVDFVV